MLLEKCLLIAAIVFYLAGLAMWFLRRPGLTSLFIVMSSALMATANVLLSYTSPSARNKSYAAQTLVLDRNTHPEVNNTGIFRIE